MVTTPIFVGDVDGPDLAVFRTVAEAEGFIEPPDVRNHDVVAYDSSGQRLEIEVESRRTRLRRARSATPQDPALVSRIAALAAAEHLEITASSDDWEAFIEAAARAIESWMRR